MTRTNRFNSVKNVAESCNCVTWGKNTGALLFAALLIVCSLTVGCSKEKPKPASSNNQIPATQNPISNTTSSNMSVPEPQPAKPATKKVVRKRPATVTYVDQTYGVSFDYPRRYGLETGNAANELVASSPLPMNFVVPGGVALAAVELPETAFAETDLSAAYFNVSVNKALTAEQCGEFAAPQRKTVASADAMPSSTQTAPTQTLQSQAPADQASSTSTTAVTATSTSAVSAPTNPAPTMPASAPTAPTSTTSSTSKLMLGDLELQSAEAVAGEGDRQSDTKYFHVFQNGGCYEFALNVTTIAHETEGGMKHVDRDKVFSRLASIMSTVKINPVAAPEVTASAPAAQATPETPAQ